MAQDAVTIHQFLLLHHALQPCDVAIGLGSFDLGVAARCAEAYHRELVPLMLFSGANSPATAGLLAGGEAVRYREHALALGVPDSAILVEPRATNTAQNITFARDLLLSHGLRPLRVLLVSDFERRQHATARMLWPGVEFVCTSPPRSVTDYLRRGIALAQIVSILLGELRRITQYPALGYMEREEVPQSVRDAAARLVRSGYEEAAKSHDTYRGFVGPT